jgi:tryptophanyl-tRNA synthetase
MRIITDSKTPEEAKDPDESTIYQLYKHFASESEISEFAEMFRAGGMGYGTAKTILFEKVNSVLSDARIEYERLMANPDEIEQILQRGASRAKPVAEQTLARVKKAMLG